MKIGTGAVSWSSKLQGIVMLSSTEAKYSAAVEAGKEICWMQIFYHKWDSKLMNHQVSISTISQPYKCQKHRASWQNETTQPQTILAMG